VACLSALQIESNQIECARLLLPRIEPQCDKDVVTVASALQRYDLNDEANAYYVARGMYWLRRYAVTSGPMHLRMRVKAMSFFATGNDKVKCFTMLSESLARCIGAVTQSNIFSDMCVRQFIDYSPNSEYQSLLGSNNDTNEGMSDYHNTNIQIKYNLSDELRVSKEIISVLTSCYYYRTLYGDSLQVLLSYHEIVSKLLSIGSDMDMLLNANHSKGIPESINKVQHCIESIQDAEKLLSLLILGTTDNTLSDNIQICSAVFPNR
jgi:hypothetical protein